MILTAAIFEISYETIQTDRQTDLKTVPSRTATAVEVGSNRRFYSNSAQC